MAPIRRKPLGHHRAKVDKGPVQAGVHGHGAAGELRPHTVAIAEHVASPRVALCLDLKRNRDSTPDPFAKQPIYRGFEGKTACCPACAIAAGVTLPLFNAWLTVLGCTSNWMTMPIWLTPRQHVALTTVKCCWGSTVAALQGSPRVYCLLCVDDGTSQTR